MGVFKTIRPAFWDEKGADPSHPHEPLDFQLKWKLIVVFTSFMALLPLLVITVVEYRLTRQIVDEEMLNTMSAVLTPVAETITNTFERHGLEFQGMTPSSGIPEAEMKGQIELLRQQLPPYRTDGAFDDVFIVNTEGVLITPSILFGNPGTKTGLQSDGGKTISRLLDGATPDGHSILAGYVPIPSSSLMLVMVKNRVHFWKVWLKPRLKLLGYLIVSIILILVSVMGMATYLVGRIHAADQKRIRALHHAGYSNKLASIGRLASGVAHEINNPLAIINEKTGLMLDLMEVEKDGLSSGRVPDLANDVIKAVERCKTVTQRLLDFTTTMGPGKEAINVELLINEVLAFFKQQAAEQQIDVSLEKKGEPFKFQADRGSIQQIIINLFNNAFAAMENGGRLDVLIRYKKDRDITIRVSDTGCGIPQEDIHNIFEPFFMVRDNPSGTGLGLYVTFGIVKDMKGKIFAQSTLGKGSTFTVVLPVRKYSQTADMENSIDKQPDEREKRTG